MPRLLRSSCVIVFVTLLCTSKVNAGPLLSWFFPDDTPVPAYSPFRYWAPGLGRAYDHFHSPRLSAYPPDRHPEIPPDWTILPFHHPAVDPAATLIEYPTPPPESKFRYFGTRDQ